MRILTIFGGILPVLGTIGLLGLWFYQQTGVEHRISELQALGAARSVFQTYQSHNALFNAINEIVKDDQTKSENIRLFQIYNYELALSAIEKILPESDKLGIPPSNFGYDHSVDIQSRMNRTQKRIDIIQNKLNEREKVINKSAKKAKMTYFLLYLIISIVALFGAVCNVIERISKSPNK